MRSDDRSRLQGVAPPAVSANATPDMAVYEPISVDVASVEAWSPNCTFFQNLCSYSLAGRASQG